MPSPNFDLAQIFRVVPDNFPYHLSALASIVADVWVGIIAIRFWKARGSLGFLCLAGACALFLVGSVYGYVAGLAEFGIFQWPLDERATYRVYLLTSFISIAAQILFVVAIVKIVAELKSKPSGPHAE